MGCTTKGVVNGKRKENYRSGAPRESKASRDITIRDQDSLRMHHGNTSGYKVIIDSMKVNQLACMYTLNEAIPARKRTRVNTEEMSVLCPVEHKRDPGWASTAWRLSPQGMSNPTCQSPSDTAIESEPWCWDRPPLWTSNDRS